MKGVSRGNFDDINNNVDDIIKIMKKPPMYLVHKIYDLGPTFYSVVSLPVFAYNYAVVIKREKLNCLDCNSDKCEHVRAVLCYEEGRFRGYFLNIDKIIELPQEELQEILLCLTPLVVEVDGNKYIVKEVYTTPGEPCKRHIYAVINVFNPKDSTHVLDELEVICFKCEDKDFCVHREAVTSYLQAISKLKPARPIYDIEEIMKSREKIREYLTYIVGKVISREDLK